METSDVEDAAMFLLHLWIQGSQAKGMPGEFAPKTVDEGYDIQDALHRFGGWPIGLLKVGCTSEIAQEMLAIPHPVGGRLPADGVFGTGDTLPRSIFASAPLLECEIALRADGAGGFDAAAPAIEVVHGRFSAFGTGPSIVADNVTGRAAVLGEAVDVADLALDEIAVTLTSGGDEVASGSAAALLGGPVACFDWAMQHEAGRGRTVEAGTWVITGTCSGLTPSEFGQSYMADFGPLGQVGFSLES